RHTRCYRDWSSDVCSSDLITLPTGVSTTNLVVTPLSDSTTEGNETLLMTLIEDPAYVFGTFAEAAVTIAGLAPPKPIVNLYADKIGSASCRESEGSCMKSD